MCSAGGVFLGKRFSLPIHCLEMARSGFGFAQSACVGRGKVSVLQRTVLAACFSFLVCLQKGGFNSRGSSGTDSKSWVSSLGTPAPGFGGGEVEQCFGRADVSASCPCNWCACLGVGKKQNQNQNKQTNKNLE